MRWLRSVGLGLGVLLAFVGCSAQPSGPLPAAKIDEAIAKVPGRETAVFAGGCFWGTQSVFQRVKGVLSTEAGYAGGAAETATYRQVTTETTGHAESVKVEYDPSEITYGKLLQIFFSVHDPTTLNRQGPDRGTSYRSAIFTTNEEQRKVAAAYIAQVTEAKVFASPIVTQIEISKKFYDAESYHQDYATLHPDDGYILICDKPKIETLKKNFPALFVEYRAK